MPHRFALPMLALSALAIAGSPALAADSPRACFFANQISSWKEAGDQTVNLRVGVSDFYQLRLLAPCPDLKWAEAIGLETHGGADTICSGLDVDVIIPGRVTHSAPQRCMATSLHKLTKDEVAALPKGQKP